MNIILVKFDNDKIGYGAKIQSKYKHIDTDSVPIQNIQVSSSVSKDHIRVSWTQFPLFLCWAVTIHKCQGMTLPEVVVDMSPNKGRFDEGQAYVAFSWVTSLEKLHIVNYSHDQIRVPKNGEEEIHSNGRQVLPKLPKPMISTVDKNSNLVLAHLNVSGIYCKLLDIQCDETLWFVDIMCFNETHLCSHNAISPEMLGLTEDFEIIRKDRNQHGGGVMVIVCKSLNPRHLVIIGNMEVVVIQITVSTEQLYIVSVYRSQQYKTEPWINDVRHLLNTYKIRKCVLWWFKWRYINWCIKTNIQQVYCKWFYTAW